MVRFTLGLLAALLLLGCARPAVPVHSEPAPAEQAVPVAVPSPPAPVTVTPPPAPAPPSDPPPTPPVVATPAPVWKEPELVLRTARLSDLSQQTEIYRFTMGQGRTSLSPDGRYLLYSACDPCDERRLYQPMLLDLSNMQVRPGSESVRAWPMPRYLSWSGSGFWIESLVHFGLDGKVEKNAELRQALIPEGWKLVAAEVSPDNQWVMAAIEAAIPDAPTVNPPDLVIATPRGEVVKRIEQAIPAIQYQRGTDVSITWAPDSRHVALCGERCWLIDLKQPEKEAWRPLPARRSPDPLRWSPTGTHLIFPGLGVVGGDGRVLVGLEREAVWLADGSGVLTWGKVTGHRLDGTRTEYGDIGAQVILGWLGDGRLLLLGMEY